MNSKNLAIEVKNISKRYRIVPKDEMHDNFVDAVVDFIKNPLKNYFKYRSLYRFDDLDRGQNVNSNIEVVDIIWALKNISFEVEKGEVVGIIGNNGAGKSTLLKILSRVTTPTTGRAFVRGRISSLLEVGTGFHPELTGRENVYLNGTILGMSKKEVESKLEEIVDFAGVEKFIDTPIKRYSSGMTVRLAFSVAAHMEPEVLLVDEVLAVGDAGFQKKCLGKMGDVAKQGRTVLLVSHNMHAIASLCSKALWIDSGELRLNGPAAHTVSQYLGSALPTSGTWKRTGEESTDSKVVLTSARLFSRNVPSEGILNFDEDFCVEVAYQVLQPKTRCTIAIRIQNAEGLNIIESSERDSTDCEAGERRVGLYRSLCRIPGGLLRHGAYYVAIGIFHEGVEIIQPYRDLLSFEVSPVRCPAADGRQGVISSVLDWNVEYVK